jgi:hypothetical protein
MSDDKKQYRFINNQTGYAIAYLSISENEPTEHHRDLLEKRRKELAIEHGLYFETIYWELDKR